MDRILRQRRERRTCPKVKRLRHETIHHYRRSSFRSAGAPTTASSVCFYLGLYGKAACRISAVWRAIRKILHRCLDQAALPGACNRGVIAPSVTPWIWGGTRSSSTTISTRDTNHSASALHRSIQSDTTPTLRCRGGPSIHVPGTKGVQLAIVDACRPAERLGLSRLGQLGSQEDSLINSGNTYPVNGANKLFLDFRIGYGQPLFCCSYSPQGSPRARSSYGCAE